MGKKKANKAQPGQREFTEQGPVGAEPANTVEDSPLEQRTELIKEYLSRQLCQPLAPGDAASPAGNAGSQAGSTQSPGSAAGGSPAGGVPGDAGSSAAGVAEVGLTSPALLQRVTAAACLRQAELKPALAAHLATTQLGKGKAEQLVELQQQLGKQQAPVAYQRLSALLKPGKRAPVLSTDVARFDGALSKEVLDSTALKDLARMLQREPQSAFSAVVAAGQHMKIHINAEDVFARKGLWKKALPSVSELRPCPEEAGGAGAGRPALELGSLAHLICREAASLAYASPASRQRGQQAGSGSDDLEEESEQPWQASLLPEGERYMRRLLKGLDLADSVLATGDPAVATFQTFHAPTFNRRSWHVAQSLRCFLRGHLLMRLQQQAAAAGVQGNSPQAQDMVRPLQLLLDRHKVPLRDLLAAACAQAGAPGSSCQLQLAAALLRAASQQAKRGLLWRPAALLLLLLQQEQQAAVGTAPVEGIQGMAAVLDQLDATGMDEAAGALFPEAEQAALRFILASLRHADELATPALRRSLAEGVLLALQRMQQRERLTTQLVDALAGCSALQLASSDRGMPDFKKLTEVPPDQLLMLYCTVAIAFGCAFQTPEDLGPTPSPGGAPSAPPGADFAAAGAVARAGLSWEADPACSPDGARLRLNAHAVQSALHQVAQGSKKQPEHCAAGWCSDCHTVVADPSANPSHVLTAVAGLAAGSLSMPGSSLSAGVGSAGGWQDAALQIHGALLGVPAAGENQALLSRLPVDPGQGARLARLLCLMGSICFVALEVLKECMFRHLEALVAVHSIVHAVQDGAALKGSPGRLRELAERALLFGEFEQMAAAARRLLTHLETLGAMSRWHASEDEMQAMLSSPGSEASLYAGWLHRCLAEERVWLNQEMAHLSSLLEPSEGAAKWPKALSVSLSVLAAKMESHMRDCSPGELFFPDPGLATALVQGAARVRAARALFDNAFDGLRGAGDALFWRCKDVLGQLRQACAVQLLAPFEELAVQRVLGARWEAEAGGAPLVAAESAVSGVTAAERAAAEAAAELEQEEAEARAAAQRRQQKQLAKQRAAEQRRLQQLEEERARRRREEEERARQAQEEAQRQAEAEAAAAAAREEGDRQRREFLLSLKQADEAGQAEDVAEAAEEPASVPESAASAAGSTAPGGAGTAVKPPAAAAPSSGSSAAQQANLQSSQGAAARPHNEVAPTPYPATAPAQQQHAPRAQDQQQRWVDDTAQGAALLVGMPAAQQAGTVPPPVSAAPGTYGLPPPQARVPHGSAAGAPPLPAWPHHAVHAGPSSQAHVWGTGLYGQGVYMPAAPAVPPTAHAQHTQHAQHAQQPWCYQHSWHAQQAPQAAPGGAALEPAPAAASHAKPWAEQAAQWVAPALDPPPATERAHAPAAVPSATQREKEAPHTPPPDTAAAPPRVPSPATEQAASPVFEGAASPTADRAPSPAAASGPAAAPAAAPEPAPAPVVPEAAAAKPAAAGPRPGTWAALAAERPQSPARPHQEQQQQQQQQPQGAATTTVAPPASQRQPGKDDLVPLGPAQVAARAGSKPAAAAAAAAKPSGAAGTRTEAAPGGQARGAPQPARLSFLAALAPDQAEMAALALPGLRNEGGEFNCFLNVLSWGPEVHAADPVLSALHSLLSELSALDFARQDAAAAAAAGASGRRNGRPVIDTTPLREALNALPGQEFKIGEMSDAGELLLVLYEHIKEAAPGPPAAQLDAAFGLHVREAVRCPKCPKTTQKQSYTQYFCNVSAAALRTSLRVSDPGFGARLRAIEDEHQKSCDTDVGGCGALYPVSHSLEGAPPRVFTLQLAWESHSEEPSAIAATMRAVGEQVDLRQLYEGVPPGTASRYRLRAMVCYYLRHYSAFVRLPELGERWVMFDDASTSAVGSWAEVRRRYEGGRVQPSVLFYEAAA
ncbi:hypothetical protein ABPG77_006404 [Micractinium sp. CCAP 211/92]